MRCHYEVLGIERNAEEKEIKVAYRKAALVWHPDKNPDKQEEAEIRFKEITAAYTILSDPQERAWYDNHRESILQGKDSEQGEQQDAVNLWGYFTDSCFDGFDEENPRNFYKVYADIFEQLNQIEREEAEDYAPFPYFGKEDSRLEDVDLFYATWEAFSSKRSFGWSDKYRLSEAPSRQVKRLMEKENKKIRDKERKKYNQTVRALVLFVKKRDPRWQQYVEQEREKKEQKQAKIQRQKRANRKKKQAKMEEYQAAYEKEMDALDLEELGHEIHENEEEEKEELYCLVCKKNFRSKNQWLNHEKSKKHLDAVERVKSTLMFDDEVLESVVATKETIDSDSEDELSVELSNSAQEDISTEMESVEEQEGSGDIVHSPKAEEEEEEDEEDEIIIMSSFRSKKNKKKQRKQQKRKAFEVGSSDKDNETPLSTPEDTPFEMEEKEETEDIAIPQPAKKKKKARRAKRKQNAQANHAHSNPPDSNQLQCVTCSSTFPSKNKLFNHLKKTGHAKPL